MDRGLGAFHLIADVHLRHFAQSLDQGVANQVGEGNLATNGARQVSVDQSAIFIQELRWHLTL